MIFARADKGDSQMIFIGLSDINLQKLREGHPIHVTREKHGGAVPEHWEFVILHGKTEAEIARTFAELGMVDDKTEIHKQPDNDDA